MEQTNPTMAPMKEVTRKPSDKRGVYIGIIALALVVGIAVFLFSKKTSVSNSTQTTQTKNGLPTPTPMPFEEMTIPALQAREYESSLSRLEQVSITSSYTSYKTSYTSDGLNINAQLTIPRDDMPIDGWGAIIFVHGYIPPASYQTFQNYASYVDYLASRGFVVFKIDLRGHGESEGEPGGAYYSSDYIVDVLNAHAALKDTDFVNPQKIGVWGHSMAGNVALRSLAAQPEISAASIWGGAVFTYEDWQKYGIDDGSYRPPTNATNTQRRRNELFDTYGQFNKESPFWSKIVATNYLKDIKGEIQLNHAVDDPVVNIGYSRDLKTLLEGTSIPHELNEYPSGGHNFTGSTFNSAMQKTVDFFRRYL